MSDTAASLPVLARIIAAHEGRGPGRPDPSPLLKNALTRAIRRAAMPYDGFDPVVEDVVVRRDVDLTGVEGTLPEHGLIAAIEDDKGRRGMLTLEHGLLDALIEVQTTGKVEDVQLPPRKVTPIDEALCRDFLDLVLGGFAKETHSASGRDWPVRMAYGGKITDIRQLNLLFPESSYHSLSASISVGNDRKGILSVALPVDPVLARQAAAKARAKTQPATRPEDWPAKLLEALGGAPLFLDGVLLRMTLPLGKVQNLAIDDVIPFDAQVLGMVTLEDDESRILARGHLGQLNGRRALRMSAGAAGAAMEAASPAKAPSPMPDMATAAPAMAESGAPPMPAAAEFDPNAPMGGLEMNAVPDLPPPGGGLPMADFDPDAPMG